MILMRIIYSGNGHFLLFAQRWIQFLLKTEQFYFMAYFQHLLRLLFLVPS